MKNENEYISDLIYQKNDLYDILKNQFNLITNDEINYNFYNLPSFRGLDNVGATCYMNATLQCLTNIKPITDYLLNQNKYSYLLNQNKYSYLFENVKSVY